MSSATSTETVGPSTGSGRPEGKPASTLDPWQFFVLAALGCATAALFATRGQSVTSIVLLTVLMFAAAAVGLAALRMLRPLVSADEDRTSMIGQRTRAALEREKLLSLRAIKELEFDRAMGKLSDADWQEMSGRLRQRAGRLIKQLDASEGYRGQIERDLAKRVGEAAASPVASSRACASCETANEADARFCKSCGQRL
jgi:hypothetical protein